MSTDADSIPSFDVVASDTDFTVEGQTVLILCGLIASGKSTFAEALQLHYPEFCRCNQDDLGHRRRVEQLARSKLSQGLSVCIDRTNFNPSQRSYWIEIAREFPGTKIWVIVFDTPYETCAARLQTRVNHPTITNAEEGLSILSRFAADFEHPSAEEGFHRILYVKPEDHPSALYSRSDISAFLRRVRDSAPIIAESYQNYPMHSRPGYNPHRGSSNRGSRGPRGGYTSGNRFSTRGRGGNSSSPSYSHRGWQSTSQSHGGTTSAQGAGRGQLPQ